MITYEILNNLLKPIAPLTHDRDIQEIMINAGDNIWIEKAGVMTKTQIKIDEKVLLNAIMVMNFANNKEGKGSPIIEGILPDGSRVGGAIPPVSKTACLSIRKFTKVKKDLDDYGIAGIGEKAIEQRANKPDNLKDYLIETIRSNKNIIVSGGTSSGKTTFFNVLLKYLDNNDRVITIEDIFELEVNVPNKVALSAAKYENYDISINDLVKLSLRMRPDKIILGEIRGAAGFDLMWAFNTGHSGGSTIHANSIRATLSQLEMYVLMAKVDWDYKTMQKFIANNVNTIIWLNRTKINGADIRGIGEIAEIKGINKDGDYELEKIF